ncbi:hypothetical protein GOODEAATRI_027385, partial [Goodea atripinnis]
LVCNLLDEGNCFFRDGDWRQAAQQYAEGVNVARYAQAEAVIIPHELLESLYVNRAAAFYQMDVLVIDLAQDLANKLGLKGRKAYISPQTESTSTEGETHEETSPPTAECIPAPLATPIPVSDDPATTVVTSCTELSESPSSQTLPPMPYSVPVSEHMDECSSSVIKDGLDSILDCMPKKVSEVLSPPTFLTRPLAFGLLTHRAFQLRHPSFPQPSSAPLSVIWPLWGLTHRCGTKAPPKRRTHWEAFLQGPQMEKAKESLLVGSTRCLSTLFLGDECVTASSLGCATTVLGTQMDQEEPTSLFSPGILWQPLTSFARLVMPVTAE